MDKKEEIRNKVDNQLKIYTSSAELFAEMSDYAFSDLEEIGDLIVDAATGEAVSDLDIGNAIRDAFDIMVDKFKEHCEVT